MTNTTAVQPLDLDRLTYLPTGWRQYVARAYVEWRKHDQSTPDDVLDLMRDILYAVESKVAQARAARLDTTLASAQPKG